MKSWDLKNDKPAVFDNVRDMLCFHNDCVKHYEQSKEPTIFSLQLEDVRSYLSATQETWLWFLHKYFGGRTPHKR